VSGSFLAALATSVLNPRAGVVAVALLPQFVAPGAAVAPTTLVLGLTWALVAAAWNLLAVAVVHRSGAALSRPRARRVTELVSGAFMAGIGVSVAVAA
jgi:threonine/homoserine/homoserine lactone efflux protein